MPSKCSENNFAISPVIGCCRFERGCGAEVSVQILERGLLLARLLLFTQSHQSELPPATRAPPPSPAPLVGVPTSLFLLGGLCR